jgi:cell division septal protein FtsQ
VTKLQIGSGLLIIVVILGLIGGLLIGLWAGWIAWPVQVSNVDVSDLKSSSQDEYIVLVASDYAFDQNLDRAEQRLAQLHDTKINDHLDTLAK